jgi:hypothetical protein
VFVCLLAGCLLAGRNFFLLAVEYSFFHLTPTRHEGDLLFP